MSDVAKKWGDESKNYFPPIPPTKTPFLLTPSFFYVRFLEFSVFQFFALFGPLMNSESIMDELCKQLLLQATASPSNQFRDYSIWNRIEKSVPQHWNFAPQALKPSKQNQPNRFQT